MSGFFAFWSLAFTIFIIYIASFVVAGLYAREEISEQIVKAREARARARKPFVPASPLAGRPVSATVVAGVNRQLTTAEQWVRDVVSDVARALHLQVRILVLQDSMGHFLVHFADRKRLLTYRVDKAWVQEGMDGSQERVQFIKDVVEKFLRAEWLGEAGAMVKVTELTRESKAAPKAAAAPAGGAAAAAVRPAGAAAAAGDGARGAAPQSREEQIAAAKARAEAIRAQRAAADGAAPGAATSAPQRDRASEPAGKDEAQREGARPAGPPPAAAQGQQGVDEQAVPEDARRSGSGERG